jgi:rare lipoprotein A
MRRFFITGLFTFLLVLFSAHAQVRSVKGEYLKGVPKKTHKTRKKKVFYGTASYYADKFRGRKTAGGATYRRRYATAACNVLPLGTLVRITNLKNKKSILVRINDRMHRRNRRLVDLSRSSASRLGFIKQGTTRVKMEALGKPKPVKSSLTKR